MITVYHANENIIRESLCYGLGNHFSNVNALLCFASGDYTKVADVDTDDLDVAWMKTNHIEESWELNEGVTLSERGRGNRSSAVGDLFEKDGKLFVVDRVGFTEL